MIFESRASSDSSMQRADIVRDVEFMHFGVARTLGGVL